MSKSKKFAYLAFLGTLSGTAAIACQWQVRKYLNSTLRWDIIEEQLKLQNPQKIRNANQNLFAYKYVCVQGLPSKNYYLVNRSRDNRMGYLIFRYIKIQQDEKFNLIVLDGWIPEDKSIDQLQISNGIYKGILKPCQNKDYFNKNFDKQIINKSGLVTYANIENMLKNFNIPVNQINKKYYLQAFSDQKNSSLYPVRYTKYEFQRPYLTPQKHLSYATFWGATTFVGLVSFIKILWM